MTRRKPRTSSELISILAPWASINTSLLDVSSDGPADRRTSINDVFNRVEVFELSQVNLRTAVAEAPDSDELYVFLVGLGEFSEKYKQEAERLKAEGKSVLMIEPRGIGLSSNPDMPGTIDVIAAAADVAELLRTEQFKRIAADKKVVLGGHSTGGNIAASLLVNHTELCNRVFCGAVIQSPAIRPKMTDKERSQAAFLTRLGLGFCSRPADKNPVNNPLTNEVGVLTAAQSLQAYGFKRLARFNMRSRGTAGFAHHLDKAGLQIIQASAEYKNRHPTEKFHGPITFIMGKDDRLIDLRAAVEVGENIGADIVVLDARHEPHLELGQRLKAYHRAIGRGLCRALGSKQRTLG